MIVLDDVPAYSVRWKAVRFGRYVHYAFPCSDLTAQKLSIQKPKQNHFERLMAERRPSLSPPPAASPCPALPLSHTAAVPMSMCLALHCCLLYPYCTAAQGKTEAALLSRSIP